MSKGILSAVCGRPNTKGENTMAEFVKLSPNELQFLHEQNPDLVSYNVEFAEVTGGTFWRAYTRADRRH